MSNELISVPEYTNKELIVYLEAPRMIEGKRGSHYAFKNNQIRYNLTNDLKGLLLDNSTYAYRLKQIEGLPLERFCNFGTHEGIKCILVNESLLSFLKQTDKEFIMLNGLKTITLASCHITKTRIALFKRRYTKRNPYAELSKVMPKETYKVPAILQKVSIKEGFNRHNPHGWCTIKSSGLFTVSAAEWGSGVSRYFKAILEVELAPYKIDLKQELIDELERLFLQIGVKDSSFDDYLTGWARRLMVEVSK